jgi:hypothetical protein
MSILIKSNSSRGDQGPDGESWFFRDLERLTVVVEDLDAEMLDVGMTRDGIREHVEAGLIRLGIPVASLTDLQERRGVATLYVSLGADRQPSGPVAFQLSVQVLDEVILARDPAYGGGATTWVINGVWLSSMDELNRDVMAAIDEGMSCFGEAFLAALSVQEAQ